jgi:hypothetical protein
MIVSRNVKVSGNYNTVGAAVTMEVSIDGSDYASEALAAFGAVDEALYRAMDGKPKWQKDLIDTSPKVDTEGYK